MENKWRRVQINAQVTAVITVFESIGNFVIIIIHIVIPPSWINRILFFVLHFIALPYLFRVNTRENKNRLVGQGWYDLLMDSIRCLNISFPWTRTNNVLPFEQVNYDVTNGICIISKNQQQCSTNQYSSESRIGCNINVPNDNNPSTSNGYGESRYCPRQASTSSTNSIRSSDIQKEFIVNRKQLLHDMM